MYRLQIRPRFVGPDRDVDIQSSILPCKFWGLYTGGHLPHALVSTTAAAQPQPLYYVALLFLSEGFHDVGRP